MAREVTRLEIEAAANRIGSHIRRTPTIDVGNLMSADFSLTLKLEHLQVTGSFKPRGAFALLTAGDIGVGGIAAASGGNFGLAVAYAANRLGHHATIFVPETSPQEKIGLISRYGAEVRVVPGYYDDALASSRRFVEETGAFEAHAYDQPEVMAGQGTLGAEIVYQTPTVDVIVVAVGGGGLIGGIASWCQGDVKVVAVEPERCASLHASLQAGRQVDVEVGGIAASSLGARSIGDHPWLARKWIDTSVLVDDDAIAAAQRWLWAELRLVVEPAAATTLAALRTGAYRPEPGANVVALLSGGNVDPSTVT